MRRILVNLTAILAILMAVSCRSSKIPSESTNKALLSTKKELTEAIAEAVKNQPVTTYYAKNALAKVEVDGSSNVKVNSVKVNLFFEYGKETVGVARLSFPPVSVGKVKMTGQKVAVNSGVLSINKEFNLPIDANQFLHDALLGRIPNLCRLYGEGDFSSFDMSISKDDRYILHRKKGGMETTIEINSDFNLHSYTISYLQYELTHINKSFDKYDGRVLPNDIEMNVKLPGQSKPVKTEIELSKITIDGKDRLE